MADYDNWTGCKAEKGSGVGYWDGEDMTECEECGFEIEEGEPYVCTDEPKMICQGCAAEDIDSAIRELKATASSLQVPISS